MTTRNLIRQVRRFANVDGSYFSTNRGPIHLINDNSGFRVFIPAEGYTIACNTYRRCIDIIRCYCVKGSLGILEEYKVYSSPRVLSIN